MSIYAIGDIHGCYDALTALFNEIPKSEEDIYIFLGDYVDRGPDTKSVIDWLINFSKKSNSIFLRGNHEIFMLIARYNEDRLNEWLTFGGDKTFESYKIETINKWPNKIGFEHWKFIENTQAFYQKDKYIFVHAGVEHDVSLKYQNRHNLYWKKYINPKQYSPDNIVICGHTSQKNGEIANYKHTICIDTFAWGGQWLTCLNVLTGEYYKANQERKIKKGKL